MAGMNFLPAASGERRLLVWGITDDEAVIAGRAGTD
jgi:hypothetical protein